MQKVDMFSDYRDKLNEFYNNVMERHDITSELRDYLLENAVKIDLDSIARMTTYDPVLSLSTGIMT